MSLPPFVRELIELIGAEHAGKIVGALGGITIRVPKGLNGCAEMRLRLVTLLGDEAASHLMRTYGGEIVSIPRCAAALRDERNRRIIAGSEAGESNSALARQHHLTDRQIRSILKRAPDAESETMRVQFSLF